MSEATLEVMRIYLGSDGDATLALLGRLELIGPAGLIAARLFRAQKASERAKVYRGGAAGFRRQAYDRKEFALDQLAQELERHGEGLGFVWGWGVDAKQPVHRHVLYVELPTGQVSFHCAERHGAGPDYAKDWDGVPRQSPDRIVRWIGRLLAGATTKEGTPA